ncbi:MAG: DUF192 domain-containing protein [Clostridia bacterium]|nr:DUF192 domain-containing protein [Clostridia bacterium]
MIVRNDTKGTVLAESCILADKFTSRFMGLMGKKCLEPGHALLIVPCNSIHMFFMSFPLDIIFINRHNRVAHLIENMPPWKVSKIIFGAKSAIEVPVGTIKSTNTSIGDAIIFF